jgi:hypothetical protein
MFVLFEDNQNHRNHNSNIRIIQKEFPGVDKWIQQAHKIIGKRRFAYLLQRAESYLLLNLACREFNQRYPNIPLFTIHDAILTHPEYIPFLTSSLIERLKTITGVVAGVKVKYPQIVPEPQIEDIETSWESISPITTIQKFNSISHSVFSSNVKRGSEFLKNFENIF